jgi:hypothetical protein
MRSPALSAGQSARSKPGSIALEASWPTTSADAALDFKKLKQANLLVKVV